VKVVCCHGGKISKRKEAASRERSGLALQNPEKRRAGLEEKQMDRIRLSI